MGDEKWHEDLNEAQRRAAEARENWRRAKEELREAFRRAREERRQAREEGRQAEADEVIEEMAETARDFAREVSEEARRLAEDLWQGARKEWHGRWREQWHKSFGKEWQDHWLFGGRRFRHWTAGDEEANPFVAAILSRGGGLLALYVLHLLAERPRHGNDIMRQIEQRTVGSWTSNPGAIYPLLAAMEENALVHSRWEDPDKRTRRIYQLTDEGRQELERLRRVLRPKVMEAIEVLHVLYDDLYGGEEAAGPTGSSPAGEQSTTTPDGGRSGESTTAHASAAPATNPPSGRSRWFARLFGRDGEQAVAYGS